MSDKPLSTREAAIVNLVGAVVSSLVVAVLVLWIVGSLVTGRLL